MQKTILVTTWGNSLAFWMNYFGWIILKSIFLIILKYIPTWFDNVWYTLCSRWDWITHWGQNAVCHVGPGPVRGQKLTIPLLSDCSQGGNDLIQESVHPRQVSMAFKFQAWKKSDRTTKLMHDGVNVLKTWPTETMTLNPIFLWVPMYHLHAVDESMMKLVKPQLAENTFGCCWQSWGVHSQQVPSLLLDRVYDRKLLTVLSFWIITGIKQLAFRSIPKRGFGNFYETWNRVPYLSHVIKISSVGSSSIYTWL